MRRTSRWTGQIVSIYGESAHWPARTRSWRSTAAPRRHGARPRAGAVARRRAAVSTAPTAVKRTAMQAARRAPRPAVRLPHLRPGVLRADPVGADPVAPATASPSPDRSRAPARVRAVDCDPADLDAWLRLLRTPGVGATARRLLAAFGSPRPCSTPAARRRSTRWTVRRHALTIQPRPTGARRGWPPRWPGCRRWSHAPCVPLGDPTTPPRCSRPPTHRCCCTRGRLELLAPAGRRRQPQPDAAGRDNARAFAASWGQAG
jgi:hypothetical protein